MTPPPPIPLEEAQRRLLDMVKPLPSERLALDGAVGRFLADPVVARRTQPPVDLSAMDGYAMRGDEFVRVWRIIGESAAGHPFGGTLGAGEAVRISTGAAMPSGAGAILLQENARREGDRLYCIEDAPTPSHIRRAGLDFSEGDSLLDTGALLGPAQIALAAAGGHGMLDVGRLPSLAILDSGDELAADPSLCEAHQIPASNGPMLAAMAQSLTSRVMRLGPVPDRMDAFATALARAEGADVLVTSGGASVGDHDLLRPALDQWGAKIDFWRVAIKPGKPLLMARRGAQWIIGLPGNPVSSYVTGFLFLLPLLRALAGSRSPLPGTLRLELADAMPATGSRLEFVRGRYVEGRIEPITQRDSSAIRSLAACDALIRREIGATAAAAGDTVSVLPLR